MPLPQGLADNLGTCAGHYVRKAASGSHGLRIGITCGAMADDGIDPCTIIGNGAG